eukprot:1455072-Prymnesium_polylepis.1
MAEFLDRPTTAEAAALIEEAEDGLPQEELLRLDDGTPLPAELTELRSLLQLQASLATPAQGEEDAMLADDEASEEELRSKAKLHALHAMKA